MGNYSSNGKPSADSDVRNGKRSKTSTITDQHRMTPRTPDTANREVSQPICTPGKNSVLSEPTHTLQSRQLDGPLRSKSNRNMSQLNQSKQLSGPERSSKCHSNPDRRYYVPSPDTKTYFMNSQGYIQSREDPPEISHSGCQRQTTRQQRGPYLSCTRIDYH